MIRDGPSSYFHELLNLLAADPMDAVRWHCLHAAWLAAPLERQVEMRQAIDALPLPPGEARFFCATFRLLTLGGGWDAFLQAREALECGGSRPERADLLGLLMPSELLLRSGQHGTADVRLQQARWVELVQAEAARVAPGLPLPASAASRAPDGPLRRVAIVTPLLGCLRHPPTRLVHAHARLLQAAGVSVAIFSPDETRSRDFDRHSGVPLGQQLSAPEPNDWAGLPPPWCAELQLGIDDRRRQLILKVDGYAPDVVLFVGLPTPSQQLLAGRWPLAVLPTVGIRPLGGGELWLSSRPQQHLEGAVAPQPVPYAYRHALDFDPARVPARAGKALGAGSKTLLLCSVGVRLGVEIEGAWAAAMVELLRADPRLRWVLVGGGPVPALAEVACQLQILPVLPEVELASVLKACDLVLNPPRLGGGLSVALAMACGRPVLSLGGSDGGDKLGAAALDTEEQYFARLRSLLASKRDRQAEGQRMQARHREALDIAQAGPALLAALGQARHRFFSARPAVPAS